MNEKLPKIEAKKSLGQHFLNNTHVPTLMAESGNVQKGDIVLEIGPGTGVLTRELLKKGAHVVAIETDIRAVESLKESFKSEIAAQNLVIVHDDVKNLDFHALGLRPRAYKLVANIPYYLSGFLFRMFLEHEVQPSCMVFLVQREVAERIARDKKESLLSLSVKVFGTPKYVKTVGKGNFTPPPKIDSAIIAISDISKDNFREIPQEFFFMMLHEGFKSKRKQLFGNLATITSREVLMHIFSALNISEKVRGEDLTLREWLSLTESLLAHQSPHTTPQS
jgi:16S rRNA (adenine1518-N6/adenine1519-N6)-dimethyltransferase